MEKRIERWEDIVTEEYIICRNIQYDLQFILRNSNEAAYCNGVPDCKSGSDELCPYVTIRANSTIFNITREQEEAGDAITENNLVKEALAAPTIYVVTGAGSFPDGVYEERREPELHYTKKGYYYVLYTDSRRPQTWIIGEGETLSTAQAYYRAPASAGRPAVRQWSYVDDGSREGRKRGK